MNILFISVDDLRTELGSYGHTEIHSPNIDKFASESRVFLNHFVQSPVCGPSRNSLLSGKTTLNWDYWAKYRKSDNKPDSIISLPQLFRENGYMTVGIGKISHQPGGVMDSLQRTPEVPYAWNKTYAPVGIWGDPWKAFFAYAGGRAKEYGYGRGNDTYRRHPFEAADVDDEGYPDGLNASEAIKQLQQLKDTTFFLAVGFYKPHMPFNAPKKYWDLYNQEEIPLAAYQKSPKRVKSDLCLYGDLGNTFSEPKRYKWPDGNHPFDITPERARILKHGYYACVSYIDAQIGKVLNELKRLGLDKNTIVVLWGDHGWHLGDYGIWGKETNFDIALRSPLIIKSPGLKNPGVGVQYVVESVDIFTTLAELCKLPLPQHIKNGHGVSLSSIVNDPHEAPLKAYSISERLFRKTLHGISVRDSTYRFMLGLSNNNDTLHMELFRNFEKPVPHTNIANDNPDIVKRYLKIIDSYNSGNLSD